MTIAKPKPNKNNIYNYTKVITYIENKYKIKVRDFANFGSHFNNWADAKGYGYTDPEGKNRGASHIWFKEYNKDPLGAKISPPYQDFWHWVIETDNDIYNGCKIFLDIPEELEKPNTPYFIKVILGFLHAEFGDELEMKATW